MHQAQLLGTYFMLQNARRGKGTNVRIASTEIDASVLQNTTYGSSKNTYSTRFLCTYVPLLLYSLQLLKNLLVLPRLCNKYHICTTIWYISLIFFFGPLRTDLAFKDRFQLENIYSDQFKFIFKFINIIIVQLYVRF